jgi:CO dehydrogenase nickel-insertion accessory protein CooC1
VGTPDDDLLHVAADHRVGLHAQLGVDQVEELLDVAQELVADALARRVDRALQVRHREDHGGRKHADADGLAEASWRRDQDFLSNKQK